MQEENINRAIIVVQMGMTPSAKQVRNVISSNLSLKQKVENNKNGKQGQNTIPHNYLQKALVLVRILLNC